MAYPINQEPRLLLEDGTSFLLLEDNTSKLLLDLDVSLDDPAAGATAGSSSPVLQFFGQNPNNAPLGYEVQVDTVNTFDSTRGDQAPVIVQSKFNAATNTTTFPVNPTIGNLIVVTLAVVNATQPTAPTDNYGNTYTQRVTQQATTNTDWVTIWTAPVTATGAGFVVTSFAGGTTSIAEVSGADNAGSFASASVRGATGQPTVNITPGSTNSLIIGVGWDEGSTSSWQQPGTGYSVLGQNPDNAAIERNMVIYQVAPSTSAMAVNYSNINSGDEWIIAGIGIQPAMTALVDAEYDHNTGFTDGTTGLSDSDDLLLEDNTSYLLLEDNTSHLALNRNYASGDYLTYQSPSLAATTYYWRVRQVRLVPTLVARKQQFTNDTTWVAPAGVTSVSVEMWGGGGGGGGDNAGNTTGGAGGGGAAYARKNAVTVTPGTGYAVVVGQGGAGGAPSGSNAGGAGTDSTFNSTTVVAKGGTGGAGGGGSGGTGGSAGSSTGDVTFSGGNGFYVASAGGGGGSAGDQGNGTTASTFAGGAAGPTNGAAGGNGVNTGNGAGTAGTKGSGGGGALGLGNNGGNGGNGLVIISWTETVYARQWGGWSETRSFVVSGGGSSFNQALTGALSFTGAAPKRTNKTLGASLGFVGNVAKYIGKKITAGLSFVGAVTHTLPLLSLFKDGFNGSLNTAYWTVVNNVSQSGGQVTISLPASTSLYSTLYGGDNGNRQGLYDMRGGNEFVQVVNAGDQSLASKEVFMEVLVDANNEVFMYLQSTANGGNLCAYKKIAGVNTNLAQVAYNSTTMQYWQIRESGGTTYWEYATTPGAGWTTLFSAANPIDFSSVYPQLTAGTYAAEASSTSVVYDNFNLAGGFSTQAFTGSLSFAGAASFRTGKALGGSLGFAGGILRNIAHKMTAGLSFTGVFTRGAIFFRNFTAALSFTGSFLSKLTIVKNLTAALSFTGSQLRTTIKRTTASLGFTSAINRRSTKSFTGGLSFTGALARGLFYIRAFTASLGFTGNHTKRTGKPQSGVLSFTGSFSLSNVFKRAFTAALSFTGAIKRDNSKRMTAGLSFTGAVRKLTQKILPSAILSFVGNVVKRATERFAGVLSFSGTFSTSSVVKKAFTASVGFTGKLVKQANKKLTGSVGFTGVFKKARNMIFGAALSFTAAIGKGMKVNLFGSLSFTGLLNKYIVPHFVALGAVISSFTNRATESSKTNTGNVETGGTIGNVESRTRQGDVQSSGNSGDLQSTEPNKTLEG